MKTLLTILALTLGLQAQAAYTPKLFRVTITNLTKGQPFTPAVVAVHAPQTGLFQLGEEASDGLKELAQDGKTDKLTSELKKRSGFVRTKVGTGLIMPGQKAEIEIEANDPRYKLSIVSMLARTNDAFIALSSATTNLNIGEKVAYLAAVYDAGAELNTESCQHIPAPPCNNPGVGTNGGEGFVTLHPGVLSNGDLDPLRDAFASQAAKISIERIQ